MLKQVVPLIRPQITARSVFDTMLERLEPHGLADNFTPYAKGLRGVGHGVGLDVVEPPNLSSDSDFVLEPGMTLAIKLDLHGLKTGGYRIEVVIAITEDGNRPLNSHVLRVCFVVRSQRSKVHVCKRILDVQPDAIPC